jgi:hypothetical protein
MGRARNPYSELLDDPIQLDKAEHQRELAAGMAISYTHEPPPIRVRNPKPRRSYL